MAVFVGGAQRSGTSLMRGLLGSHPDLAMYQWDLPFWTGLRPGRRFHRIAWSRHRSAAVAAIANHQKYRSIEHPVPLERLAEDDSIRSWGDLFGGFMELYAAERGRPRWGYKTPGNELHADAIFGAFPDARLIQMVRDPRDVAVSFRAAGGGTWAYDPEAHRRDWRASVEAGIAGQERWPGQWMVVRYEDLVADREAVMRAVCGFCGLDFNPAVLEGRAHPGWTGENSSFDSAGSRADRDPDFVGRLEPIYDADLGRLMRSLGYPVDAAGVTEDRRLRSARASVVKPLARAVIDAMTA